MNSAPPSPQSSWLIRHEFLLRRLHSLSGLIPVGAYMVVHLLTNASILNSAASFQENVYRIHSLGRVLWLVEWGFIFLPLIFHAVFGFIIIRGGLPNSSQYAYASNIRYTLQRVTGIIAFLFIFWHVFQMHGWFHSEFWLENVARPLGGAKFRPFNASTSLNVALTGIDSALYAIVHGTVYAIGLLACVFHLANGIWTMGITWGVWVSPAAQRRANWVCLAFGVGLAAIGLSALTGGMTVELEPALRSEGLIYESKVAGQLVSPERVKKEHKRWPEAELETVREEAKRRAAN